MGNKMWHFFFLLFSCAPEEAPPSFDPDDPTWRPTAGAIRISNYDLEGDRILSILSRQAEDSLSTLQLQNTNLDSSDAIIISQDRSARKLSYLSLKDNLVQNKGAQYIALAPFAKSLVELNLDNTGISSKGLEYLLRNPDFGPKKLIVRNNSFHSSVLHELVKNTKIESIDLSNCKLTQGGTSLLLAQTHARIVKLNQNDIGIPPKLSPHIEKLYLYQTRLTDDQIKTLATIEAPGLKHLYLGRLFIEYQTLAHMSHAPWFPQLEVLAFNPRKQSKEEKESFANAYGSHRWLNLNDPPLDQNEKEEDVKP